MLRSAYICIVRTVLALLLGRVETPAGFTLEALPIGEHVAIHYESRGCFHNWAADLVFTRVADGLSIELRNAPSNLGPGWHMEVERRLGVEELRQLDRMLAVHRRAGIGFCTTVERLRIRWPNAPIGHFTESVVDSTCSGFERTDIRSFGSLLRVVSDSTGLDGALRRAAGPYN